MATQVNKKMFLYVTTFFAVAIVLLGGLWFLYARADAGRNIRRGDAYMATGDYENAAKQYSRGVSKEPSNLGFLEKWETAIESIQPPTQTEAKARYQQLLLIRRQRAIHQPSNLEFHEVVVNDAIRAAQMANNSVESWQIVEDLLLSMQDAVGQDNFEQEAQVLAQLGRAKQFLNPADFTNKVDEQGNVHFPGEEELRRAVVIDPNNDLAWSSLALGRLEVVARLKLDGRNRQSEQQSKFVEETFADLERAVADKPLSATALARFKLLEHYNAMEASADNVDQLGAEKEAALDQMASVINQTDDPIVVRTAANLILAGDAENGYEQAVKIYEDYLSRNPNDGPLWIELAQLHLNGANNRESGFSAASDAASKILVEPNIKSSLDAILQFAVQGRAASILSDVAISRWEQALKDNPDADLSSYEQEVDESRKQLLDYCGGDENNVYVLRADGQIAWVNKDYRRVVDKLEAYRTQAASFDLGVQQLLIDSLAELGQIGLAYELVSEGLNRRPSSNGLAVRKAQLEAMMGRYADASETVSQLPLSVRENDSEMSNFSQKIDEFADAGDVRQIDPISAAINEANLRVLSNDMDLARASLLSLQEEYPQESRIPETLAKLAIMVSDKDLILLHLNELKAIDPELVSIRPIELALENDDPIQGIYSYWEEMHEDPVERDLAIANGLRLYLIAEESRAKALIATGHPEAAADLDEKIRSLTSRLKDIVARLSDTAASNPKVVEFRVFSALDNDQWDEAEQIVDAAVIAESNNTDVRFLKAKFEALYGQKIRRDGSVVASLEVLQSSIDTWKSLIEDSPYEAKYWEGLAEAYKWIGDEANELQAYEEAYRRNPNNLKLVKTYANALIAKPDGNARAIRVLKQALVIAPTQRELRELWLQLETEEGNLPLVMRSRLEAYASNPSDITNAANLVRLISVTQPTWEFLTSPTGEPLFNEQTWERLSDAEKQKNLADLRQRWDAGAQMILDDLSPKVSGNRAFASLKASLLMSQGQVEEGAQLLKDRINQLDQGKRVGDDYIALAKYFVEANRFADAKQAFIAAIELDDNSYGFAVQQLSNMYISQNLYADAITLLEVLHEKSPSAAASARLIECLIWDGRLERVESELAKREEIYGIDFFHRLMLAQWCQAKTKLFITEGDQDAALQMQARALEELEACKQMVPSDPTPYIYEADGLLDRYGVENDRLVLEKAVKALDKADQLQTSISTRTGLRRVKILRLLGNSYAAESTLRQLVARFPEDVRSRQLLIEVMLEANDIASAVKLIEEAIEKSPYSPVWYEVLGSVYASVQNSDEAIKAFLAAYKLSRAESSLLNVAFLTRRSGVWNGAPVLEMLSFNDELRSNPVVAGLYARALDQEGQKEQALDVMTVAFQEILDSGLDDIKKSQLLDIWFMDLRLLYNNAESSVGEAFVMGLPGAQDDSRVLQGLALFWLGVGPEGQSRTLELLQQVIDSNTLLADYIRANHIKGQVHLARKEYNEAKKAYLKIIDRDEEDSIALNNVAYILQSYESDPVSALPLSKKATSLDPNNIVLLDTLADIYRDLGQAEKAIQALDRILAIDPNNLQALLDLSGVYTTDLERPDQALSFIQQANQLAPQNARILDQLGWINFQLGNDLQAEEYLRESLQLEETPNAYMHLAQVLAIDGRFQAAIQRLKRADELATNPKIKAEITALRADIDEKASITVP